MRELRWGEGEGWEGSVLYLEEAKKIHGLRLVGACVDVDEDHHHRRAQENHVGEHLR